MSIGVTNAVNTALNPLFLNNISVPNHKVNATSPHVLFNVMITPK